MTKPVCAGAASRNTTQRATLQQAIRIQRAPAAVAQGSMAEDGTAAAADRAESGRAVSEGLEGAAAPGMLSSNLTEHMPC